MLIFDKRLTTLTFFYEITYQCYWVFHLQSKVFIVFIYVKNNLSFNNLGYQIFIFI
jgi:hypothetical protein